MVWELLDLNNYSITDTEMTKHLEYLAGKGYLRIETNQHEDDLVRVFLSITPSGIDLASGLTTDIGVAV